MNNLGIANDFFGAADTPNGIEPSTSPPIYELAKPLINVTKLSNSAVTVSWLAIPNAEGYRVTGRGASYDAGNVTSYPFGSLPNGQSDFYVTAYAGNPRYYGEPSNTFSLSLEGDNPTPVIAVTVNNKTDRRAYGRGIRRLPPANSDGSIDTVSPLPVRGETTINDMSGGIMNFVKAHYLLIGAGAVGGYFLLKG